MTDKNKFDDDFWKNYWILEVKKGEAARKVLDEFCPGWDNESEDDRSSVGHGEVGHGE